MFIISSLSGDENLSELVPLENPSIGRYMGKLIWPLKDFKFPGDQEERVELVRALTLRIAENAPNLKMISTLGLMMKGSLEKNYDPPVEAKLLVYLVE